VPIDVAAISGWNGAVSIVSLGMRRPSGNSEMRVFFSELYDDGFSFRKQMEDYLLQCRWTATLCHISVSFSIQDLSLFVADSEYLFHFKGWPVSVVASILLQLLSSADSNS